MEASLLFIKEYSVQERQSESKHWQLCAHSWSYSDWIGSHLFIIYNSYALLSTHPTELKIINASIKFKREADKKH